MLVFSESEEYTALQSDTMSFVRRNGKPRSCEPCRKLKAKCDHKNPVCGRCRTRCIAHECFYHPAPLTRPKPGGAGLATSTIFGDPTWTTASSSQEHDIQATVHRSSITPEVVFLDPLAIEAGMASRDIDVADIQLNQVLASLVQMDAIGKLVRRWSHVSDRAPVPTCLLEGILVSVESAADRLSHSLDEASRLTNDIKVATSKPFVVPPSMLPTEFSELLEGTNLRLEGIGLILSVAGNAVLNLFQSDMLFHILGLDVKSRQSFAKNMLSASDTCIDFCDQHSVVNDVMAWLRYENFLLTLNCCGYASHRTWSRSGQLFSDVYAMEVHREPKESSNTPWFLDEIRTRLFASVYYVDKVLSNILGKLPRVPRHYCNRRLPLNIGDDKLFVLGPTLEDVLYGFDSGGWSLQESYPSDWLRTRYVLATFREEILSIKLGPADGYNEWFIREITARVEKAWEGLPTRLRHHPSSSDVVRPYTFLSILLNYLDYLDVDFRAQQLLYDTLGTSDDQKLLKIALSLVSTAVNCTRRLCRNYGASKESAAILWIYGLPSGVVLANALRERAQLGQEMSYPIPWAELYRQLSVLASEIEANIDPNENNFLLYNDQRTSLSEQLDLALNARHGTTTLNARPRSCNTSNFSDYDLDVLGAIGRY